MAYLILIVIIIFLFLLILYFSNDNNAKSELDHNKNMSTHINYDKFDKYTEELPIISPQVESEFHNTVDSSWFNPQKTIVLDTETTGLSLGRDEILQLAVIDGNGSILFNHLIKPRRRKQWPDAEEIHGITPKMVENEYHLYMYRDDLINIFSNVEKIIGYNLQFDLGFIKKAGFDINEYIPKNCEKIDVMEDFAPIYGSYDYYHDDFRYKSLKTCARYYKYSWSGQAHDALEDSKATLHCWLVMNGLKEMPSKIIKNSPDALWNEFCKKNNKHGKRITRNDLNLLSATLSKFISDAGYDSSKVNIQGAKDDKTFYFYYSSSLLFKIKLFKSKNYIVYNNSMRKYHVDNIDGYIFFYWIDDIENNIELQNYIISQVKNISHLIALYGE